MRSKRTDSTVGLRELGTRYRIRTYNCAVFEAAAYAVPPIGLEDRIGFAPMIVCFAGRRLAARLTVHLVKQVGLAPTCATHDSFTDCSRKLYRALQQMVVPEGNAPPTPTFSEWRSTFELQNLVGKQRIEL